MILVIVDTAANEGRVVVAAAGENEQNLCGSHGTVIQQCATEEEAEAFWLAVHAG